MLNVRTALPSFAHSSCSCSNTVSACRCAKPAAIAQHCCLPQLASFETLQRSSLLQAYRSETVMNCLAVVVSRTVVPAAFLLFWHSG